MRAIVVQRDPSAGCRLARVELARTLGPDEVLVRMQFAPINPADLMMIQGSYAFPLAADAVLGAAGVGQVAEIGAAVAELHPGDLVLPLDRGNWCDFRIVDRARLLKVPSGTDPMRAALMRINPLTARLLLDMSGVQPGDLLVQNAARSSVAEWVRHLAARRNVAVANLARAPAPAGEDVPMWWPEDAEIAAELPSSPRAALDCVAGAQTGRLAALLGEGGNLLVYGHLSGQPCSVPSVLLTGRGLMVRGFSLRRAEASMDAALEPIWAELWDLATIVRPEGRIREIRPLRAVLDTSTFLQCAGEGGLMLDLTGG